MLWHRLSLETMNGLGQGLIEQVRPVEHEEMVAVLQGNDLK